VGAEVALSPGPYRFSIQQVGASPTHRGAVPDRALGEVLRAHHLAVLDQGTKYVSVALITIASRASHRYPTLPLREARGEARAQLLLIGILVGELVQARAIGVDPVEVCGSLLALGQAVTLECAHEPSASDTS
jgi:hypothetical protein